MEVERKILFKGCDELNKFRLILLSVVIVAIIFGGILGRAVNLFDINNFNKALEGFFLFASISLGFFGTCISILATLIGTKIVKDIIGVKNYKVDFVMIALSTIMAGFTAIIITILFQIFYGSEDVSLILEMVMSGLWSTFVFMYLVFLSLFIFVVMLIFLKAGEDDREDPKINVVEGRVKKSVLEQKKKL